jgi:hypothetical protein
MLFGRLAGQAVQKLRKAFLTGLKQLYVSAESGNVTVFRENGKTVVTVGSFSMPHAPQFLSTRTPIWSISLCKISTAILFCGSWIRAERSDPLRFLSFVALVLHRVNPHFRAVVGASGNSQVEAVEAFSSLSKIPGGARPYSSLDFSEKLVMIGIVLLEHADVAFSAGDIHALAGGVVIQIVGVLNSRKRSNQAT